MENNITELSITDSNIIHTSYSKDDDLFIINHAYLDMTISEIARYLQKHVVSIYQHMLRFFEKAMPCQNHKLFQMNCNECMENWKLWHNNAIEIINSSNYISRIRWIQYTKEMDLYLIDHLYEGMSFNQIGEHLHLSPQSIMVHINSFFDKSPKCNLHRIYYPRCESCASNLLLWKKHNLEKINNYNYNNENSYQRYLQSVQNSNMKKKKKRIEERTIQFKEILSEEIYDNIIAFMCEHDLCWGRDVEILFKQIARLFINNYLKTLDFSQFIPFGLLKFFFSIHPITLLLNEIILVFTEKYIPISYPLLITLKDITKIHEYLSEDHIFQLFSSLLEFNNQYLNSLEGNCASILYLWSVSRNCKIVQSKIINIFDIAERTLRTRSRFIVEKYKDSMNNVFKTLDNITELSELNTFF